METVAVVLMVLGLIGVGSALVVLVRLRGQLERLGEQVDRVARRVEALPPDLSRVAPLRHRQRRTGRHRHHRRPAGLPGNRAARLHPQPTQPAGRSRSWGRPGELQSWFGTDADCLDYLEWLRWPAGFLCPDCGHAGGWRLGDGRFECARCQARTSTTAGTIFDRTRTPLTVWFTACWMFATDKGGVSALGLQRALEIGSYQTAWTMLHRLRSVLVRPGPGEAGWGGGGG